jgi:hypothetical protein
VCAFGMDGVVWAVAVAGAVRRVVVLVDLRALDVCGLVVLGPCGQDVRMADPARYHCVGALCPYCIENRSGRASHAGHWGYRHRRPGRKRCWMPLQKPSGFSRLHESVGIPAAYGSWEKNLPSLCAFLCDLQWADGSSRVGGKLSIWTGDSLWKGCLADQASEAVAFWSAQDGAALLNAMEKALKGDRVDWRRSVPFEKRRTKRG